ncbi:MAG: RagB/SusD family nutrient uptake outer membrane protein [Porphyromonas sp.]|nr:RagB/SusD family nutrient uptake outer membrane protein [Porphyromonas sp.]
MKKIFIISAISLLLLSGCNDFLDIAPHDRFTNTPEYWSNKSNLENQTNTFLNNFVGYGNGGGAGWFYFKSLSDDQVGYQFNLWTYTNTVSDDNNWYGTLREIRRASYIIEGLSTSTLAEDEKKSFEGIARLNRAYQYYQLVRMYGDVPWVDKVVSTDDDEILYAPRTDRDQVMDRVLEDLQFASQHIKGTNKQRFTADMALAVLSEVALYEGTYSKYRTAADNAGKGPDTARAAKYLKESVKASQALMKKGYKLSPSYKAIYNSIDLSSNPEIIFYKPYSKNVLMHSTIDYTINTSGTSGMTKDAFDAYLFLDGKPKATTGMDTNDAAQLNADGKYDLTPILAVRDKRLSVILDPVLTFKGHPYSREGSNEFTSSTGYGVAKYDNPAEISTSDRNNIGKQYTDSPLFWLSVIYLNYAEAKAELNELTQADLDMSINKLQDRAGLPPMTVNPEADPANNMGVSNIIWEIRRARRCELMFDNWYRYWDLIRWHQLHLMDSEKYPNIYLGANLKNVPDPEVDVTPEGYMIGSNTLTQVRRFDKKYYFYPIPTGQITMNDKITQNPGW